MRKHKKSTMIYRYLFSFILILSVPIILFGFLLQVRFMSILTDEIIQNDKGILNRTVSYNNWVCSQFDSIQQQIALNRNLRPFALFGNAPTALDCVHELNVIKNSNDLIFEMALFYKEDGHIYTGSGSFTPWSFLKTQVQYGGEMDKNFNDLLHNVEEPVVLPAHNVLFNDSYYERVVTFIYPIKYSQGRFPDATLVIFALEKDFFMSLNETTNISSQGMTIVVNNNMELIMSNGVPKDMPIENIMSDFSTENAIKLRDTDTWEVEIDGITYLCNNTHAECLDWQFNSFRPISYVMVKTESLRIEMLIYFLIIIVLASLIINWSIWINYRPIKGLRDFAASLADMEGEKKGNELDIVQTAVLRLHDKNVNLIASTNKASCEYILRNLLKGRYSEEEFFSIASGFGLQFPYSSYLVLSIYVNMNIEPSDKALTIANSVARDLQESLTEGFNCYLIEGAASSISAIIVNCNAGELELLLDRLAEIRTDVASAYNCELSVGAGHICDYIRDIPTSYMESLYALDYRFVKGNNSIISVGDVEGVDPSLHNYPYSDLERLKYLLKLGDVEAIEQLLDAIISYMKLNNVPLFIARRLCFDIIGIITKSISDIDIPLRNEKSWISLISRFETMDELIVAVRNMSINICSVIKEDHLVSTPLIDKLRLYARENCLNSNFSIQEMADYFDMGVTHLSQYFKNKSGQTIIDFTTEVRMSYACKLLESGKYKHSDISEMCGYSNHTSFIRRFKQFYNETPGQYAQRFSEKK